MNYPKSVVMLLAAAFLTGCASTSSLHQTTQGQPRDLTVGAVQKNISTGMSQPDVTAALGSPNIVTRDTTGTETWVYDQLASEVEYSEKNNFWTVIFAGGSRTQGTTTTSTRTLTILIKFDTALRVKTVTYHRAAF